MNRSIAIALSLVSAAAVAAPQHTKADAQAMVQKAAAFIKANGKDKALAEFNSPQTPFTKGDLYVFASDFNGVILAHTSPKMVGKSLIDLRDSDGKLFIKGMIEIAAKGKGWFDYRWVNPATKTIQHKVTYVEKAGDDWFIACGVYDAGA